MVIRSGELLNNQCLRLFIAMVNELNSIILPTLLQWPNRLLAIALLFFGTGRECFFPLFSS